jgi:hypothetical protein
VGAQQARGVVAMDAIAAIGIAATEPKFPHTAFLVLSFPSLKSMSCVDLLSIHLSLSTSLSYCSSSSHIYKGRRSFTFLCALLSPYILSYKMHYTKYDVYCLIVFSVVTTLSCSTVNFNSLIISVRHKCITTFPTTMSLLLLSLLNFFSYLY